jgi:membrane fusion protein (multidrug efflux system)
LTDTKAPAPAGPGPANPARPPHARIPWVIGIGAAAILALGGLLLWHADRGVNKVALGSSPRPVTTIVAARATYRDTRSYVGALEPWLEASVGPQYLSAYVTDVLVRPGAVVRRGDVVGTLDCGNPSAITQSIASQAHAIQERQAALADEAARTRTLLDGGFVSTNEVETKVAASASEQAQFLATRSRLLASKLDVRDCVLRAPFDGEVATRSVDTGGFVHPGQNVVTVIDRGIVRLVVDAPEKDFDAVAPSTAVSIHILATGRDLTGTIARRAPKADPATRTVHFEADLQNPDRDIPVGTTAVAEIAVGEPVAASSVPLEAVSIRGTRAQLLVVEQSVAHQREVALVGEARGIIYLDPQLAQAQVIVEGRALVKDGDPVIAKPEAAPPGPQTSSQERGGGYARPQ